MRFTQPDTIVPGMGSQAYNRYSYVENSPLNYIDTTGHYKCKVGRAASAEGYTSEDCVSWVEQALDVLRQTKTGQKLVDKFLEHDQDQEITIYFGATVYLDLRGKDYEEITDVINTSGNAVGNHMYMPTAKIAQDPSQPNNWGGVLTFAHEIAHVIQKGQTGTMVAESEAFLIVAYIESELDDILSISHPGVKIDPAPHPVGDYVYEQVTQNGYSYDDEEVLSGIKDQTGDTYSLFPNYPLFGKDNINPIIDLAK